MNLKILESYEHMINFNFKNKNVFISAASKGIGFEIVGVFSFFGANIVITSSNKQI